MPFENVAFKSQSAPGIGFNLITQNNSFSSVFDLRPLEGEDASRIENLLIENFVSGVISDDQVESDIARLKGITSEIKAIGRQSVLMMGERVHLASELLKPYRDGTFTKWLEVVFGSRKTGYNALSYYTFFNALPDDTLRRKFRDMPQKSAYILASRKGGCVEVKAEIVRDYHSLSHGELVALIQSKLPVKEKDGRSKKNSNAKLLSVIRDAVAKIDEKTLTTDEIESLIKIFDQISLLSGRAVAG